MSSLRALPALATLALIGACAPASPRTTPEPSDGTAVLEQMHDRYAGRWYHSLTFVQRTTQRRPDGTEHVTTWYEALLGSRLRIDMGDPALGNGALYTADSLYVIRGGTVTRTVGEGNPFLPLIAGVYLQPLDTTLRQLAPYHVDLTRLREQDWEGRPTWVIGARSAADSTSPQVWIDRDRLIVVRFLMPLFPSADHHNQDVRLENNVPVGGGWLATRVRFLDNGVAVQTEDYSDWHADVPLRERFLQAEHWSEGPHWFVAPGR